jgi:3-phenylpropionate/trans-cinnamate dioxygenase ferredoxin reductase subunit
MSQIKSLRTAGVKRGVDETFVIVGAGQAGAQAASTLRERGFQGRIVVLGDEGHLPYMRPPLSKRFLAAEQSEDRLYFRPQSYFESQTIEMRTGIRVDGIDRRAARLRLASGELLYYDKLLLATGSRPRVLSVPGATRAGVHYLRTLDDALRLRSELKPGSRLVVVGAGYLGLEVAATAATAALRVTLLEIDDRILNRVTTPGLSGFMADVHRSHGVDLRCGSKVVAFSGAGRLESVLCEEGAVAADVAVVGIGAVPNDELAREAGLNCNDGISVDDRGQTTDPHIYAAGDCTRHENALFARRVRLESVQNAIDQATVAAVCMAGGALSYRRVPWFWSNQYEFKLQSAGLFDGYDEIVERGDRRQGRFALLYRKAGQLIAVDAVNMPAAYLSARREIALRGEIALDATPALLLPKGRLNPRSGTDTSTIDWPDMTPQSVAG